MKINYINLSNETLQKLLNEGDKDVFNEIYKRFWKSLYGYANSLYNEEKICEDIVQEVFMSLWEKYETVELTNIEAYLFRAIKYKISSHIRGLKYISNQLITDQKTPQLESSERNIEYLELETNLLSEIDKLTPKCKNVFLLSRFEYLSNNEIAIKLNISIRTVEKHISDAIKQLKSSLHLN
ncbi:RNA polymerase sigma-70 factor [Gelidibacter salicanalis]|uniref:RNA polymerase sigma-70 factor n=1 Tax=Gelidibacter salicanalis TaxID=291193 RepID=A0A5C7AH97_9FLAO|nr:RNA polymerase sigma-70 factor [Gelidibacter salicanalis]TXE07928.1 RNA polymerase sigma-70 factor [Gelidibacter salicanalis]